MSGRIIPENTNKKTQTPTKQIKTKTKLSKFLETLKMYMVATGESTCSNSQTCLCLVRLSDRNISLFPSSAGT